MNNRYFGNIHDYYKYGLLHRLAQSGLSIGVCWMLTPDEGEKSGGYEYLKYPDEWCHYDPLLFNFLSKATDIGKRRGNVGMLKENATLMPADFFDKKMPRERSGYFNEMLARFVDKELIFLDPDCGLYFDKGNPSRDRPPRDRQHRYLLAEEIERCYNNGHSVLFYQDLYPEVGIDAVAKIRRILRQIDSEQDIYFFETDKGMKGQSERARGEVYARFFLLTHGNHAKRIGESVECFKNTNWCERGRFSVEVLRPRIGVFIDAENYGNVRKIKCAYQWIQNFGDISCRFAYGKKLALGEDLKSFLRDNEFGFPETKQGKNEADFGLSAEASDQIAHDALDVLCVMAGDSDYHPLAYWAKKRGVHYFGIGELENSTPQYRRECKSFYRVCKNDSSGEFEMRKEPE